MLTRPEDSKMTRVGIFYDGGFFSEVSDFYKYYHERKARLSIDGIHAFAKHRVADEERVDAKYCHIVDAHYFRGRFSADSAQQHGKLLGERKFDDVLMRAGVVTHYLPRSPRGEKGIDVWLALEAFELAIYKRFNVLVLIACDSDFLPLARKLNTLGTRVMLLGWDIKYVDKEGQEQGTRTSIALLDEVTYPIMMDRLIEDKTLRNDPLINGLFLPRVEEGQEEETKVARAPGNEEVWRKGKIKVLKDGFGFIADEREEGKDWFFHWSALIGKAFADLRIGDAVEFRLGEGERGPLAKEVRMV